VVTAKYRVEFFKFVVFPSPIPFEEIQKQIGTDIAEHFLKVSTGTGIRLAPKVWRDIFAAVQKVRPQIAQAMDALERTRTSNNKDYKGDGFRIVAQEKDAISFGCVTSWLESNRSGSGLWPC